MRQGRTPGYFPDLKAGTGVGIPAPRQNVVSEVRADPGAGSFAAGLAAVADGFTNYFAEQTQVELAKSEKKAKQQAQMDAQQAYESGVTSVSSEIMEEYKGTYADTYSSALGSLKASDAIQQFAAFATAGGVQDHEIPGALEAFYKDNDYGKGTGNLNFDAAFQKSWTANTEKLRHASTVAAAQKIKDTARKAVDTAITDFAINTGTPSYSEVMDQAAKIRSVYRGYTEGEAISHVFGIYGFQATQSITGATRYLAMLNQNLIPDPNTKDEQGTPGVTSFAKRFPRQAMELRTKAFASLTKIKTYEGQQKLTELNTYVSSLKTSIENITNISDINDMDARFTAAGLALNSLKNTSGVTIQGFQQTQNRLNKAKEEYATLISGYKTVNQIAFGSVEGLGDAIEDLRFMKPEEKDKAIRVFLGQGDLSDPNFFNKFTNAFRNFSGLEQKPPQAFLDIIREQFSSGDRNAMAGVVAFAKTLDRDGSVGEAALGKDSENRILYEQARVVGIEAAVSYTDNPEYKAAVNAGYESMKKGLGVFLDPTLTKAQDKADEAEDFYQEVGNALDNQTTVGAGKPPSQNLKNQINKVLPILKARLEAAGTIPSQENLREAVVEYFKPRTLVSEETVMLALPDSQRVYAGMGPTGSRQMPFEYNRGFDPKFQNAYIGTYAQPATKDDPQDTYGNMRESVKNMPIPGVDGDELSVTIGTGARTGFGVIRSNKNFGAPVMFNAGQVIKKPKGLAATRFSVNLEYRDGYTFTGDYSKDQEFVRDVLGSEYQLLPTGRGSYQLVILPFFKDIEPMEAMVTPGPTPADIDRRKVLRSTAGASVPLVPSTRPQAGEGM